MAITKKTKAILPVHYAGVPCAMDEISDISSHYNLNVIEDAAQSLLSTYKGKHLGTLGDFGALSFHETKNIICGEGGALLINKKEFIRRSEIIWEKGTNRKQFFKGEVDKYTWVDIGSSFLPSEIEAAFLYAQLQKAEHIIAKRRQILSLYFELLRPLELEGKIRLPYKDTSDSKQNGHIFYIRCRSLEERNRLLNYLKQRNVHAVFHYIPLHSSPAGMKFGRQSGSLDVTNRTSNTIIRLPLFYELDYQSIEYIASAIVEFYSD